MSRVGRNPIPIPEGVQVSIDGGAVTVQGPRGQLSWTCHEGISIERRDGTIVVERTNEQKVMKALHGLTRSLIANMVEGVSQGFQKSLEVVGVGYRAQNIGERVQFQLGFSHLKEVVPPPGVEVVVEGTNRIHVQGIDKHLVGQVAAQIRALRPSDPYKGKGLRYVGEPLKLRAGKTAAKKKA